MTLRHALRWYPVLIKDLIFKPAYRPRQFWERRHSSNQIFWTVGRRAFDEQGNKEWYGRLKADLIAAIKAERLDVSKLAVCEIGAGIGYWTRMMRQLGCKHYLGIEIAESAVNTQSLKA